MTRDELINKLEILADEIEDEYPGVAGILHTVRGAMRVCMENSLAHHVIVFAHHMECELMSYMARLQ